MLALIAPPAHFMSLSRGSDEALREKEEGVPKKRYFIAPSVSASPLSTHPQRQKAVQFLNHNDFSGPGP